MTFILRNGWILETGETIGCGGSGLANNQIVYEKDRAAQYAGDTHYFVCAQDMDWSRTSSQNGNYTVMVPEDERVPDESGSTNEYTL